MALEGLDGLIKHLEAGDSWQRQRQFRLVMQHWPRTVGFAVARQTRPVSIRRTTLYVAASTAAWAQTLAYERFNILRKLNRHQHPPLKDIRFSTAQWAQAPLPAQPQAAIAQHPSYIGTVPQQRPSAPPLTPETAFQRWAQTIQSMQRNQAQCDRCRCRCPQGELDRWGICALCAAKQWH